MSGLQAVDVFKKLKAAVDTEMMPVGGITTVDGGAVLPADNSGFVTAGVASGIARRNWEEAEELDELAPAPQLQDQKFIK